MSLKRKQNHILGLDKGLPIKMRKKFKRPDTTYRSNFETWTKLNTVDNTYTYDANDLPSDPSGCRASSCPNFLGYDIASNAGITTPGWEIQLTGDYSQYFNGALRFFAKLFNVADAGIVFNVSIASTSAEIGVNDDIYNINASQVAPGEAAYIIDLTQAPDNVTGTGWDQTVTTSVAISITIATAPTGDIALSTFDWYEDFSQVDSPKLVKLYCLDGLALSRSFEVIESPCQEIAKTSSVAYEFSFTVQSDTDDLYEVLPNVTRSNNVDVLKLKTVEKVATSYTDPNTGTVYAEVSLPSVTSDVCAPVDVLVTSQCTSGGPKVLQETGQHSPNQELPNDQFYVARGLYDSTITNKILLNQSYIGETIGVDYYDDVSGTLITETDSFENTEAELYWDYEDENNNVRTIELLQAVITGLNDSVGSADAKTTEFTIQVPATDGEYLKHYIPNA